MMNLDIRGKIAKLLILGAVVLSTGAHLAFAQSGLDSKSRDLLIQKLSHIYLNLAPSDSSKVALTMRLADLHAERARLDAMSELEKGCTTCNAGREDRLKALSYYREVLAKVPETSMARVLTQMGHLYEMTGNEKEATATYTKVISENRAPEAVAEAHLSLAEMNFKQRRYAVARTHYVAVLSLPQAGSRGLAAYRLAWCQFNEGNEAQAVEGLVTILKSPALLSRGAAAGVVQVDKQFHEEVSRDLVTFLARKPLTTKEAQLVFELSPAEVKVGNLVYLASEAERLGQLGSAIALWRFAQEKQSKPILRLEGHIRLAQLQMEQKNLTGAISDFEMALGLWTQTGCKEGGECRELKARMRKLVTDWNHLEKKSPSEALLTAYASYLKVFPNESDMSLWAAQVASDLKKYGESVALYQKGAALAASATPATGKDSGPEAKELASRIEAGLLGAIEAAELSKDSGLLDSAYDTYLKTSRERKKALEVRYQKARLIYDRADYPNAALALREVALSKDLAKDSGALGIKKQAADLSLDSLVLVKDDKQIEAWAAEYAKVFTKDSNEFGAIARKSVLTQSAQAAEKGSLEAAWTTLSRFDLATASDEDKAAYYKNKLILAEKLQKFGEARDAVEQMLRAKNLAASDLEYALSRKAWLAELVLDFDTALVTTQKLEGSVKKGAPAPEMGQKLLKLAMYAELAKKDAKPFYAQYMKASKDDDKNAAIAAQMVREAKDPVKEIELHRLVLSKRPELHATLWMEIFGKTPKAEVAKKALAAPGVKQAAGGKVIARALLLEEIEKLSAKISGQQIDSSSQAKLAKTLKARVAMLEESEKLATRAIESGDWTAQLVALDLVAKQSDRFYQEVLGLPVPAGLSGEQEQEYLQLLSQQASPHQMRAQDVGKKLAEFWANADSLAKLEASVAQETGSRRALLMQEIKALASVAPEAQKARLTAMASKAAPESGKDLPSIATLEGARQAVREAPMDRTRLVKLLELERQMGRQAMVAYLESRVLTLEKTEEGK